MISDTSERREGLDLLKRCRGTCDKSGEDGRLEHDTVLLSVDEEMNGCGADMVHQG